MNQLDRFTDLLGCAVVHVDKPHGLVVFWNGSVTFLEYGVDLATGTFIEEDSWTVSFAPSDIEAARRLAERHYGLSKD